MGFLSQMMSPAELRPTGTGVNKTTSVAFSKGHFYDGFPHSVISFREVYGRLLLMTLNGFSCIPLGLFTRYSSMLTRRAFT